MVLVYKVGIVKSYIDSHFEVLEASPGCLEDRMMSDQWPGNIIAPVDRRSFKIRVDENLGNGDSGLRKPMIGLVMARK